MKLYTKGLSFTGINYLSQYGISPTLKSFKNYLQITSKINLNELFNILFFGLIILVNFTKEQNFCLMVVQKMHYGLQLE